MSEEVDQAYARLESYFSDADNHLRRIRNKVAFHFDPKTLGRVIYGRDGVQNHEIVFGDTNANTFYLFAEEMLKYVIYDTQDDDTTATANERMRKINAEVSGVLTDFMMVADGALMEIALHGCGTGGTLGLTVIGEHTVTSSEYREMLPHLFIAPSPNLE